VTVYRLDPLTDPRWPRFVESHADASVFHTRGWLEALRRTYGYEPLAFTTSPPHAELSSGIAVCRISSWLTGRRLVSLPFADHCEPLTASPSDGSTLIASLRDFATADNCGYLEIRPRAAALDDAGLVPSGSFAFHHVDLRPPIADLFGRLHKSTIQRKIRRAEQAGLGYERGTSESLLRQFYDLMVLTRRRHTLPPQPIAWFRNLVTCLGDRLTIRVATLDGRPVASVLTLSHGRTLVYKYGCSDAAFHHLGSMPFVLWKVIEEAKAIGMDELDLGRSDWDNTGLITFKDRWGAVRSTVTYLRGNIARRKTGGHTEYGASLARRAFARMPDRFLTTAGRLLYRHIG
jgi:hypothetical protein